MSDPIDTLKRALGDRYQIDRALGQGGMATVYLALDLRHHRQVAIKVLRPELAAVLGAERFVQEVTTTAQLQHPNILALFDSGEADGFLYYVMPYVEGETLRGKLDREKQLGIDEALSITSEVADALDYAHRHGVIHRDIKPENILLHEGRPLVADFGIALAVSAAAGPRMTETGMSVGTPHYMSPEQATAEKHITNRSDIYSLGTVLYEMLTGSPPYTGLSAQQIIVQIVADPVPPVTQRRKSVPPNVAAALGKALEKLPADRFESARTFADALKDPHYVTARAAEASRAVPPWGIVALAAVAIASAALAAWGWLRGPPTAPVTRYPTTLWTQGPWDAVSLASVAISPDGGLLVYRDPPTTYTTSTRPPTHLAAQLYLKRRRDLTGRPLEGTEGGANPFFSPDGRWIGFFAHGELRKMPATGGGSVKIADIDGPNSSGAWLDDGSIVYVDLGLLGLRRVSASGGASRVVMPATRLGGHGPMLLLPLPHARGVMFTSCTSGCQQSRVYVYDARTDTVRALFDDALGGWYESTGQMLYLTRAGTLLAVPWDNEALQPTGPAVPILDGIQIPGFAISSQGTALYALGPPLVALRNGASAEAVWVDRRGRVSTIDSSWHFNTGGAAGDPALSPDGRRLAIRLLTRQGRDIWIKNLPTGSLSRLTQYDGEDRRPRWTPDGRGITFVSDRPPPGGSPSKRAMHRLWTRSANGTGEATLLWGHDPVEAGFWTPDAQSLILLKAAVARTGVGFDIMMARPGKDTVAHPLLASTYSEQSPALSPDGHWLAYVSHETGTNEVFVRPFPDVQRAKWQVSQGGGASPVWSHSGRELFYLARQNMMVVAMEPGSPVAFRPPKVLFPDPERVLMDTGGLEDLRWFDVAPDDQHFIMVRDLPSVTDTTAAPKLVVVENFLAELRAKLAGGR